MLHSASVLSFILWSSYLSLGCFPLPLSEMSLKSAPSEAGVSANLTKRDPTAGKFFLGYRYAKPLAAWEYENHGTRQLTDIQASSYELGEGAYLAPNPGEWEAFGDYVRLIPDKLLRKRLGLPPVAGQPIPEELKKVFFAKMVDPKRGMEGIWDNIKAHGQKVEDTILVSGGCGDSAKQCFQMLIPPFYLRPSPIYERPGGKGDLGMHVNCVKKGMRREEFHRFARPNTPPPTNDASSLLSATAVVISSEAHEMGTTRQSKMGTGGWGDGEKGDTFQIRWPNSHYVMDLEGYGSDKDSTTVSLASRVWSRQEQSLYSSSDFDSDSDDSNDKFHDTSENGIEGIGAMMAISRVDNVEVNDSEKYRKRLQKSWLNIYSVSKGALSTGTKWFPEHILAW
ncbi:hypothetical protein EV360DRAFT_76776 [Lentinula raphanica]|nr:hypothetical protein EV360DRAFT_76776 [Lentinula raphanica]